MTTNLMEIPGKWEIPYRYSAGKTTSRFFEELRNHARLMGIRCPQCRRVLIPPRGFCERCFVATDEWVPVGPGGVLELFTVVMEPFEGFPPPPYVIAFARPDGADASVCNFLEMPFTTLDEALGKLKIGARVTVRFKERREGRMTDFVFTLAG